MKSKRFTDMPEAREWAEEHDTELEPVETADSDALDMVDTPDGEVELQKVVMAYLATLPSGAEVECLIPHYEIVRYNPYEEASEAFDTQEEAERAFAKYKSA